MYYAHSSNSDLVNWQTIKDHLKNTAEIASRFGSNSNVDDYAYLAALLHDIGNYSEQFPKRLADAPIHVDYSTSGDSQTLEAYDGIVRKQ